MNLVSAIREAASARNIPAGTRGLWEVNKLRLAKQLFIQMRWDGRGLTLPPGEWTSLFRMTDATMHLATGELVMHDFPPEINKHMIFMLRAHGDVLITGLGLGCVTRGCLANPAVRKVTVIENSPDVLDLVYPHMPKDPRLEVIFADALEWTKANTHPFDCAWHDLWIDESQGQSLQLLHSKLIAACSDRVPMQGAWEFPREHRRAWREFGVI